MNFRICLNAAPAWLGASALALAALSPSLARAVDIAPEALFLSPTAIPVKLWDPINVDPGGKVTFSAANVPGATRLLGVRILPILNADPNTAQGNWTSADLHAINAHNYSSAYAFQPGVDYSSTTISSNSSEVTFGAAGTYFVQLKTSDGSSGKLSLFKVEADDFLAPDDPKIPNGEPKKITLTPTDLMVISDGDPDDHGAMANAQVQFPNAAKAKTIAELIKAISDYYFAHGKKRFEVMIIGHGAPGVIKIGTETIANSGGDMTPGQFADKIKKYVNSVHFGGCSIGKGGSGRTFMSAIASWRISEVTAYTVPVTYTKTYVDDGAKGKDASLGAVPEPQTWAMLIVGFGALGLRARRRRAGLRLA
jgi:hypothetical protein